MDVDVLFAGVPVTDFARARAWYVRLFGREPDILANDEEVLWQVAGAGWLYVVADVARAGGALVAMAVADLDATVALLVQRDVAVGPAVLQGEAGRKAVAVDPDGNSVALIEVAAAGH